MRLGADQPEPAILGGTEDELIPTEQAERRTDMAGGQSGNIGTDEHYRARRASKQRPSHADPKIATALADSLGLPVPTPGTMASPVRGHRNAQMPAPVRGKPAQQPRDHQPLEAQRRDIADLSGEPSLADAESRRAHKQNQVAPHQPYSRTIRSAGTPAR